MKQLAIIGPTASGKSNLAIKIAQKIDAYILSIDSLSIYKDINIVSAKPSQKELDTIRHFGIDMLYPHEYFSAEIFITLYKKVVQICQNDNKNLIIVGGTSFYLKSLIQGLSPLPCIDAKVKSHVALQMRDLEKCYKFLLNRDSAYMQKIDINDSYRIEKALLIFEASGLTPSKWFENNPPLCMSEEIPIYNISVTRDVLRERIAKRTKKMLEDGLIDEVCSLEKNYSRLPNAMGSIGISEVLEYLDGNVSKEEMLELISIHTSQLAKRQQTFNKTQFNNLISAPLEELEDIICFH